MWKLGRLLTVFRKELRLAWAVLRDPRAPKAAKLATVLAILYVLSPIDLIPDAIPVLGWLPFALVLHPFLPRQRARCLGRRAIQRGFRKTEQAQLIGRSPGFRNGNLIFAFPPLQFRRTDHIGGKHLSDNLCRVIFLWTRLLVLAAHAASRAGVNGLVSQKNLFHTMTAFDRPLHKLIA